MEGNSGFSVEVLGRTGLRYREGTSSAFADSELLVDASSWVIGDSVKYWEAPKGIRSLRRSGLRAWRISKGHSSSAATKSISDDRPGWRVRGLLGHTRPVEAVSDEAAFESVLSLVMAGEYLDDVPGRADASPGPGWSRTTAYGPYRRIHQRGSAECEHARQSGLLERMPAWCQPRPVR